MRGPRLEALDEFDFLVQHGLLALELGLLLFFDERALLFVQFVIAGKHRQCATVDFHHFCNNAVHEFAVM